MGASPAPQRCSESTSSASAVVIKPQNQTVGVHVPLTLTHAKDHSGTCWAHAVARTIQSTLVRVCGYQSVSDQFIMYASGRMTLAQLEIYMTQWYWNIVEALMVSGKQHGFSNMTFDAMEFACKNWYPFMTMGNEFDSSDFETDRLQTFMYDRYLPRTLLMNLKYPGSLSVIRDSPIIDRKAADRLFEQNRGQKMMGHAMVIVGDAWVKDSSGLLIYAYVLMNSWGTDVHSSGQGFWQLAASEVSRFQSRVVGIGFNKFRSGYEQYQEAWDRMNSSDRQLWQDGIVRVHNNLIRHIPGVELFKANSSLELRR